MNHSPESLLPLFEVPAGLWSGEPLKLTNHLNLLYFTSNTNIGKKISKKLNLKINKLSYHLNSAYDNFNHTLLRK